MSNVIVHIANQNISLMLTAVLNARQNFQLESSRALIDAINGVVERDSTCHRLAGRGSEISKGRILVLCM